jgi:hypothetical protein
MSKLKENAVGAGAVATGTGPFGTSGIKRRQESDRYGIKEMNVTAKVSKTASVHKGKKKPPEQAKLTPEGILRESIKTIIEHSKYLFYKQKSEQYLQEQQLRAVIRKLVLEADRTPLSTTGENYAFKALDRILTGFKQAYMDMTTSKEQRDNFVRVFTEGVKNYLTNLDQQRGKNGIPAEEKPEGGPVLNKQPEVTAPRPEEPEDKLSGLKEKLNSVTDQTVTGMQGSSADVTGANEAFDALRTALPQIGEEYEKLSLDTDRKDFYNLIFGENAEPGSLELTVRDIEKELNEKVPSTAGAGSAPTEPSPEPSIGGDEEFDLGSELDSI